MKGPRLIWFRNDLRVHDHPGLSEAAQIHRQVLGVYCFDASVLGTTPELGVPRAQAHRLRFLVESVLALKSRLQALGSDLVVRVGQPETILPEIAREIGAESVHVGHSPTIEDQESIERTEEHLRFIGILLERYRAHTMLDLEDYGIELEDVPNNFTQFRAMAESQWKVRRPLPEPTELLCPPTIPVSDPLPNVDEAAHDPRASLHFQGGEKAAHLRVKNYFWEKDRLKTYKQSRNGLLGEGFSTKLSPWLSLGCLSPRTLYREVKWYEEERTANDSTYWLVLELLWRDFFHVMAEKFGAKLFQPRSSRDRARKWEQEQLFEAWAEGKTGVPLIDANMIELKQTGFMSTRGRQLVASYLTKDLGLDWHLGAEWFESLLIDHDPATNYGNWQYIAGRDADGAFNAERQAQLYDPKAQYVKHWLPELKKLNPAQAHQPELLGEASPYLKPILGRLQVWKQSTA